MGWLSVEYNDKWSCFDTCTDFFVREFDERESYESWRKLQYGSLYFKPIADTNTVSMKEALASMVFIHDHELCVENLVKVGLSTDEAEKLIYDAETEYVPIVGEKFGSVVHKCSSCGRAVLLGQKRCFNINCGRKLVWR